jgi:polyisoprenoid-binding protein YceI
MTARPARFLAAVLFALTALAVARPVAAADTYQLDPNHMWITFKVMHGQFAESWGRFNALADKKENAPPTNFVTLDGANSVFNVSIKAESIDTGVQKRDDHLRSADFFNVKQFPEITFKSTKVEGSGAELKVTGDLTLHGVTKSVTIPLKVNGPGEFPAGVQRVGFSGQFTIKRTDYGMTTMVGPVGDEVTLVINVEATRK